MSSLQMFQLYVVLAQLAFVIIGLVGYNAEKKSKKK